MTLFNCFDDIPLNSQQTSVNRTLRFVAEGKLARNLLLHGSAGTGKTTLAGHLPIFFELSSGGIKPVEMFYFNCDRKFDPDAIDSAMSHNTFNKSYVEWIVLDEVDKVPLAQRKPLHSLLSENNADRRPAILIANSIEDFPEPILSRCRVMEIFAPSPEDYLPYAMKKISKAGKQMDSDLVLTAIRATVKGDPDIRKYEEVVDELIL